MTATTNTTSKIATLTAQERVLREAKAALKAAQTLNAWEQATKARNPQFVLGSVRKPTVDEIMELGATHGRVCSIECATCRKTRVVNTQDAFQARFCKEHKKAASRESSKIKRADKRLSGKTVEDLQREIDAANEQLAAMTQQAAVG